MARAIAETGCDEILLEARILAVADTVETMSSPRPLRPAIRPGRRHWKKSNGTVALSMTPSGQGFREAC